MKNILSVLAVVLSVPSAFAGESAREIYAAANVPAFPQSNNAPRPLYRIVSLTKSVGGLVCQALIAESGETSYACQIAIDERDECAIYSALAVPVRTMINGNNVKLVGGLECVTEVVDERTGKTDCGCRLL